MADPFRAGIDALFTSVMADDAIYFDGVVERNVRVIRSRPDRESRYGDIQIVQASTAIEMRQADIAIPAIGHELTIAGIGFKIVVGPIGDVEELTWTVGVEPV